MSTANRRGQSHRGVALLIVLAALMVAATTTTILLQAASEVRVQREIDHAEASAQDLLSAMEMPIHNWLATESAKVVLPPDARVPAVNVLHDEWTFDAPQDRVDHVSTTIEITITAFDQCGMLPMRPARSGSPLRLSLPTDVLMRLDVVHLPAESDRMPLGLDVFEGLDQREADPNLRVPVFPRAVYSIASRFGPAASPTHSIVTLPKQAAGMAIGELVATHNHDPVRININTAPMPLVEAAMRAAGFGGIEQIVESRAKGKLARVGTLGRASAVRSEGLPQIVSQSDCWSFRIDLHIGNLRQSWWATYAPGPDDPNTPQREAWMCVQRMAITE